MTRPASRAIPILMYHYLGAAPEPGDEPYYVTDETFDAQMRALREGGYETVTLRDLLDLLPGDIGDRKPVVITFDDGHRSFHEIGAPILRAHGHTATMFVITSRVGKKRFLTWEEMDELRDRGMSFQSHTVSHPILTEVEPGQAKYEIEQSKKILESKLREPVYAFAYRGGHFDSSTQRLVKEAGYACAVSTQAGFNGADADLFALKRIAVRNHHRGEEFLRRLHPPEKAPPLKRLLRAVLQR